MSLVGATVLAGALAFAPNAVRSPADAPVFVEIALVDGGKLRGEWVGSHVHDYWAMEAPVETLVSDPKEVTQIVFDPDGTDPSSERDRALRFVSSKRIRSMTAVPSDRVPYREFLRKKRLCFRPDLFPGDHVPRVERENFDRRDHLVENGEGLHGWDFGLTPRGGRKPFRGQGRRNEDYYVWNAELRLPMAGHFGPGKDRARVDERADGYADGPTVDDAPRSREGTENFLVLGVYGNFQVVVAHLRHKTVPDRLVPGALVDPGAVVARIGNSGWSDHPHLHLAMLWNDRKETKRQWSVPAEFCDVAVVRDWKQAPERKDFFVPTDGLWLLPTGAQ